MSRNINAKSNLLSTVAASAADATVQGGDLLVTGVEPIELKKVSRSVLMGTLGGNSQIKTITYGTKTAGVVYSGYLEQRAEGKLYRYGFQYECPSPAPADAAFYAAIAALIQGGIDGNQILGSVSSSGSGVVFTASAAAATVEFDSPNLSAATTVAVNITAAGSSFSTGVFTSGAATGMTVGKMYRVSMTGVTGANASRVNGKTFFCLALTSTTFFVFNLIAASTLTTTTGTYTVLPDSTNDQSSFLGLTSGYSASSQYIGYEIEFEQTGALDSGIYQPQAIFADATANSNANVNDLLLALTGYLDGSSASTVLNTIQA